MCTGVCAAHSDPVAGLWGGHIGPSLHGDDVTIKAMDAPRCAVGRGGHIGPPL